MASFLLPPRTTLPVATSLRHLFPLSRTTLPVATSDDASCCHLVAASFSAESDDAISCHLVAASFSCCHLVAASFSADASCCHLVKVLEVYFLLPTMPHHDPVERIVFFLLKPTFLIFLSTTTTQHHDPGTPSNTPTPFPFAPPSNPPTLSPSISDRYFGVVAKAPRRPIF